jgi:hypothetical protein
MGALSEPAAGVGLRREEFPVSTAVPGLLETRNADSLRRAAWFSVIG